MRSIIQIIRLVEFWNAPTAEGWLDRSSIPALRTEHPLLFKQQVPADMNYALSAKKNMSKHY